jgi:hypothetical protein
MSTLKDVEKLGRQAWLASLGAYGSSWKYAVEKFDQTYTKTNVLVNELISEGEKIEVELKEKMKAKEILDSKIIALKDKLGLNEASESERLAELTSKVDILADAVTKLVETKLAEKATKVTKPAAKKSATKATKTS